MRFDVASVLSLIVLSACTHAPATTRDLISIQEVIADPGKFHRRHVAVSGYWVEFGGRAWLFPKECPVSSEAVEIVLETSALANNRETQVLRSMQRESGTTLEGNTPTINSEVAEFTGEVTFEFTQCPPEPETRLGELVISNARDVSACVAQRLIVSRIETLRRVKLKDLPSCFQGAT